MKRFGQTLTPFKIIPRLAELGSRSAAQALSELYTRPVNDNFKVLDQSRPTAGKA